MPAIPYVYGVTGYFLRASPDPRARGRGHASIGSWLCNNESFWKRTPALERRPAQLRQGRVGVCYHGDGEKPDLAACTHRVAGSRSRHPGAGPPIGSFTRRLMLRPFLGLTSQITVDGQFSPLRCSIATLASRVRYPTRIAIAARATTRRWPIDVTHHHCPLTQRAGKCIGDGTPVARPSCVTTDK